MSSLLRVLFVLLLMVPSIGSTEAACPDVGCHTYYGYLGDECICMRTGLVDYNGGFTRCKTWTRTLWVTVEPGSPQVPMEICGCDFWAPCTHGPV